jgi:hypothetical protein
MNNVYVTSHIGRDLLQSANVFKTADVAIWEYIVNSLQYVEHGTKPKIAVDIEHKQKRIIISDNGAGMDLPGLNNFFTMHGENIERLQGRQGRGKYGTGKSAAFGIGKKLIVSTVRNGLKNEASLSREEIEASDGGQIPINLLVENEPVDEENGTQIIIESIFLQKIDSTKIIKKIEKHLQSFRQTNPEILVGEHICRYREPSYENEFTFKPEGRLVEYLEGANLIVKISATPLPMDERGILVSCGAGNLVALEDAGVCSKEMGEYLFGEIDVPSLESEKYEMDAFDSSRDLRLRPEHPVVIALQMFIGTKLEEIRKELVSKKKDAAKEASNKNLQEQADKIANLLNSDFKDINEKILEIRSSTKQNGPMKSNFDDLEGADENSDEGWVSGLEERGNLNSTGPHNIEAEPKNSEPPDISSNGVPDNEGDSAVDKSENSSSKSKRRSKGGFEVEYKNMGSDEDRATFTADKGVFTVNLDHPVLKSALKNLGTEDIGFIRLSHEIVFTEYALALANMAAVDDPDLPADDAIYDARETINRISAKSALLYEA